MMWSENGYNKRLKCVCIAALCTAFSAAFDFNGDISQWDVSKATTLEMSKYLSGKGKGKSMGFVD